MFCNSHHNGSSTITRHSSIMRHVDMSFVACPARSFCQRAALSKHPQGKTDLLSASGSSMHMHRAFSGNEGCLEKMQSRPLRLSQAAQGLLQRLVQKEDSPVAKLCPTTSTSTSRRSYARTVRGFLKKCCGRLPKAGPLLAPLPEPPRRSDWRGEARSRRCDVRSDSPNPW